MFDPFVHADTSTVYRTAACTYNGVKFLLSELTKFQLREFENSCLSDFNLATNIFFIRLVLMFDCYHELRVYVVVMHKDRCFSFFVWFYTVIVIVIEGDLVTFIFSVDIVPGSEYLMFLVASIRVGC